MGTLTPGLANALSRASFGEHALACFAGGGTPLPIFCRTKQTIPVERAVTE
jgi:hypothetical protein